MRKLHLEELGRPSIDEFLRAARIPVIVFLDNIRSGLNVGSIFRTCDAFGVERIILSGISPTPPHREIHKTAIGATESVAWSYTKDAIGTLTALQAQGYFVLPVEQTDRSVRLDQMPVDERRKYVLIFGNEVEGVSDELLALCSNSLEIPQYGTKHSFNVAVSAGIVLWEFAKSLR